MSGPIGRALHLTGVADEDRGARAGTELGQRVADLVASRLGVPAAILASSDDAWRLEAESWPAGHDSSVARAAEGARPAGPGRGAACWTSVPFGEHSDRWMLVLPGNADDWWAQDSFAMLMEEVGALLGEGEAEIGDGGRIARSYHRFCRRLARVRSAEELHELILRVLAREVRADVAALAIYSESERQLEIVATLGYPRQVVDHLRIPPGHGVFGNVFATRRPVLVTGRSPEAPRRLRYRTDSYLAIPLEGAEGPIGVVAVTDRADGKAFDHADLGALRLLAGPASLALAAQRIRHSAEEVTRLASMDSLTGLFNRRYFDIRLEAELQRARRHGEPLTLLMVDIDNFKAINDQHGHIVGDRLLRCIADRLRRGVRIFDVCARYGGDEFAVLMPSSTLETAMLVGQRIRSSVHGHCGYETTHVTVSIGIAHSDGRERDLLSIADRALLKAKAAGKNAVSVGPKSNV
jgi:diguanylate cyclase (GGDEF)-like protein